MAVKPTHVQLTQRLHLVIKIVVVWKNRLKLRLLFVFVLCFFHISHFQVLLHHTCPSRHVQTVLVLRKVIPRFADISDVIVYHNHTQVFHFPIPQYLLFHMLGRPISVEVNHGFTNTIRLQFSLFLNDRNNIVIAPSETDN